MEELHIGDTVALRNSAFITALECCAPAGMEGWAVAFRGGKVVVTLRQRIRRRKVRVTVPVATLEVRRRRRQVVFFYGARE